MTTASAFRPALVVVDFQEDFCPPHGSLAVGEGRDIAQAVNELLSLPFVTRVATKDWHPADHVSFASNHPAPNNVPFETMVTIQNPNNPAETATTLLWPDHCIQGTPGAMLVPELNVAKLQHIVEKGQDKRVEMYSAFRDPFKSPSVSRSTLDDHLKKHAVTHVYVVGLAMDYCVKHTALHSAEEGYFTCLVKEATRAVDPSKWADVEEELAAAGIKIVSLKVAMSKLLNEGKV